MSFSALYEYMHGEFQDVTRVPLAAAGVDPAWIIDPNGVKIAGHQIELWDAETGGTQLLEGVDYSLVFLDTGKTAAEGIDIWAGYQVINVAYQGIPLYLTARIIGGYTQYSSGRIIQEYEQDGQHITKWDTRRMEIIIPTWETVVDISTALGAIFYSSSAPTLQYVEPFIAVDTVNVNVSSQGVSIHSVIVRHLETTQLRYIAYSPVSDNAAVVNVTGTAIGRWK